MLGELAVAVDYFIVCDVFVFGLKWGVSCCQFEEQYSQCPNIDSFVVLAALNNFWGDVVYGAAEGLSFAVLLVRY